MTTIIMRTSHDNRTWSFSALFQGFHFLGNLPITLVLHEAPTGTQEQSHSSVHISGLPTHTKEACECSRDLSQMAKPLDQIDERLFLLFHTV